MASLLSKVVSVCILLCIVTTSGSSSSDSNSWSSSDDISRKMRAKSMGWRSRNRYSHQAKTTSTAPFISDNIDDSDGSNDCTDNMQMPNFCDYASSLWDDTDTPLSERNNIGMAKYLSSTHVMKALSLGKLGKIYKLSYEYTNDMPAFGTRSWYTSLRYPGSGPHGVVSAYYEFDANNNTQCGLGWGWLDQRLMTSANGNSGTQFDGLGHVFYINGEFGDHTNYLFFNGFTGSSVMKEHGVEYIGIEQLPPLVTRAILVDVAGYIGHDPLPQDFQITTDIVVETLHYQQMSVDDIEEGDALLFYTGWANAHWTGDPLFYYAGAPGLTLDTVVNIFGAKKVLLLGSDNPGVEYVAAGEPLAIPIHMHWIVCHGGFLYENLKLVEWTRDARSGDVPYVGGFYYAPAQIQGGVGGLGTPMVIL